MRAQVTLMVVIGILILLAVAGLSYVYSSIKSYNSNPGSNNAAAISLTSCLQSSLSSAVATVSQNGGVGTDRIFPPVTGNNFPGYGKVSYWIMTEPLAYYGNNYFLYFNNSNTPSLMKGLAHVPALYTDAGYTQDSIQKAISDDLLQHANACKKYYSSILGRPQISISKNRVEAIYQVKLTSASSEKKYSVSVDVPLKQAYDYAKEFTTFETAEKYDVQIKDFSHKFVTDRAPGFRVNYVSVANTHNDSLIILQSDQATLGGSPYKFVFAVEDRPAVIITNASSRNTFNTCDNFVGIADPDEGENNTAVKPVPGNGGKYCTSSGNPNYKIYVNYTYYGVRFSRGFS